MRPKIFVRKINGVKWRYIAGDTLQDLDQFEIRSQICSVWNNEAPICGKEFKLNGASSCAGVFKFIAFQIA